jgi:hypothetical protein
MLAIVNFNVYVSDELARRLAALAKRSGTKRNTLIRKALESWVSRAGTTWPEVVLEWSGEPSAVPFESFRGDLGGAVWSVRRSESADARSGPTT